MSNDRKVVRTEVLIIGGGQAGLAVGRQLQKLGLPFRIIDAHARIGDAWRCRWDSLRLFTPARYCGLPGLPFPGPPDAFPGKEEMADYLDSYARHFGLPVQTGVRVEKLSRNGELFVVDAGEVRIEAEQVVVAMSNYQQPRVPGFARDLDPDILQLHSFNYRNPSQLKPGSALVVGVGNSGGDISLEVARTRRTWLAGKESGHMPWSIEGFLSRWFMVRLVRFVGHHVLTLGNPIGRKARPRLVTQAAPLIRVRPSDLEKAGIQRVPRVAGVRDGKPVLSDGRTLDVDNVIWCTGFRHGFPWIDIPLTHESGLPAHQRGVVESVPGLYFVGLSYLYAMSSATIIGIARDAQYVARKISARSLSSRCGERPVVAAGIQGGRIRKALRALVSQPSTN